ncbi:MAG: UDP-N-acetylmuramoyl-L-alanine--D-glutamate ligase [Chlamydiales bacterium]
MKKVAILGLGISGRAVANYLLKQGIEFIGVDRSPEKREDFDVISQDAPIDLEGVELVVKSPGVALSHPWVSAASQKNIPIMGEIDLALKELQGKGKTIVAITGTNGKTTTTLFLTHLLNKTGRRASAVGNIGTPLISQIEDNSDFFVIELSSYQLETIVFRPVFDAALILNITPNHLERHRTLEAYAQTKLQLQYCIKKNCPFFVQQMVLNQYGNFFESQNRLIVFDNYKKKVETILSLVYMDKRSEFHFHDLENFSAAYALLQYFNLPEVVMREGLETFKKPPHRIEFVRKLNGVTYIDDSKATNLEAVKKAVGSISGEIVLIAGGIAQGGSFREWIPLFTGKVVCVLATGQAAKAIYHEIGGTIKVQVLGSLRDCVQKAYRLAKADQTVLLSPGCSSFDQFKDYQHRGEEFKKWVLAIEEKRNES